MNKHTPGPWHIFYIPDGRPHQIEAETKPAIGSIYVHNPDCQANAHLIAAAPDMLEALEESAQWWGDHEILTEPELALANRLEAVIAKAKGG